MATTKSRRRRLENVSDSTIIKALTEAGAILADAARLLALDGVVVSRSTLSRYVSENPKLREALEAIEVGRVDFAEQTLWSQVQSGDGHATRFFLSTKARSRGYGKNVEVATPLAAEHQESLFDYSRLSHDELRLFCALAHRAQGKKDVHDNDFVMRGILPPHPNDTANQTQNRGAQHD